MEFKYLTNRLVIVGYKDGILEANEFHFNSITPKGVAIDRVETKILKDERDLGQLAELAEQDRVDLINIGQLTNENIRATLDEYTMNYIQNSSIKKEHKKPNLSFLEDFVNELENNNLNRLYAMLRRHVEEERFEEAAELRDEIEKFIETIV